MAAALVLSFAWGALTYREIGATQVVARPVMAAAVAGSESPPGWVADFATAFCDADAEYIASRLGPPLEGQAADIEEAFASREWSCSETRYLGGGSNGSSEFYAYVTVEGTGGEHWWVFTVRDERVVAIE
ncbi:MAG: hypothetical protein ACRDGT_03245 [Candidatus Limnocylindria bacterium]